jgi:hypothetical protein
MVANFEIVAQELRQNDRGSTDYKLPMKPSPNSKERSKKPAPKSNC